MNQTHTEKKGKGYIGKSMSVNAHEAYEAGDRPLSKWTKTAILEAVEALGFHLALPDLKNLKLEELRFFALERSGWHHTSKYYNRTFFYTINEQAVQNLHYSKIKGETVDVAIVFFPRYENQPEEERTQIRTGILIENNTKLLTEKGYDFFTIPLTDKKWWLVEKTEKE